MPPPTGVDGEVFKGGTDSGIEVVEEVTVVERHSSWRSVDEVADGNVGEG